MLLKGLLSGFHVFGYLLLSRLQVIWAQPYKSRYFLQEDNSGSADEQDSQVYDSDRERKTLSKLTIDQLIHLKQAVANGRVKEAWEAAQGSSSRKWKFPTKRDDGWWPEYEEESYWKPSYEKKGKEGGLDKFFYTTISILSFLAFGGYILCLIIQAVRRANGVTIVTTTMATTLAGRRKRSLLQDPTTPLPYIDNTLDDTYSALISLSEAYAKYENFSRAGIPVQP